MIERQVEMPSVLLTAKGLDTRYITALLVHGNGAANGHAYLHKVNTYAWFAVECYQSQLETEVFVMHELVHAIHYKVSPGVYFTTADEKAQLSRQLIAEGVATYITCEVLGISDAEALWGMQYPPTHAIHG